MSNTEHTPGPCIATGAERALRDEYAGGGKIRHLDTCTFGNLVNYYRGCACAEIAEGNAALGGQEETEE